MIFSRCKMTRADVQAAMDILEKQENAHIETESAETGVKAAQTEI